MVLANAKIIPKNSSKLDDLQGAFYCLKKILLQDQIALLKKILFTKKSGRGGTVDAQRWGRCEQLLVEVQLFSTAPSIMNWYKICQ